MGMGIFHWKIFNKGRFQRETPLQIEVYSWDNHQLNQPFIDSHSVFFPNSFHKKRWGISSIHPFDPATTSIDLRPQPSGNSLRTSSTMDT
jgi:hypothetical protein